jgi:hypothetical protein
MGEWLGCDTGGTAGITLSHRTRDPWHRTCFPRVRVFAVIDHSNLYIPAGVYNTVYTVVIQTVFYISFKSMICIKVYYVIKY